MLASVKPPLALKKRILSSKQRQLPKLKLGELGENRAVIFLKKHNFRIIDQNVICRGREIDIIAQDLANGELVFVEVKTRHSAAFGDPSSAVDCHKLRNLQTAALGYLQTHPWENGFRFDIITVLPGDIEHYRNVTM